MKKAKIKSRWIALAAACALLGLTVPTDVAYGATGIDLNQKCSITFSLSSNYEPKETEGDPEQGSGEYVETDGYGELQEQPVTVNLYKVADVNVSGKYTEPKSHTVLYGILRDQLTGVDSGTTAAKWMEMASLAAQRVEEGGSWGTSRSTITLKDSDEGRKTTIEKLTPGLYLILADPVVSDEYIYTFTPYLVSLPGNHYYNGGDDQWIYDVEVGLKASQEHRYGDLEIQKTLDTYNAALGETTAVFRIVAEKGDFHYSDVVSIVFDQAGTRSVLIRGKIPPKAAVKVTEIYSGASYELSSAAEQTAPEIVASDQGSTAPPSVVSFTNTYDPGRQNTGTSIVNHFTKIGENRSGEGPGSADPSGQETGGPEGRSSGVWDVRQLRDSNEQSGEE